MPSPEYQRGPSPEKPLNAPGKRPTVAPALIVLGILGLVAVVFLVMFMLG
jgi:hypothetical protein